MKVFSYADEKISAKEIFILVPSMILGVGILTLPRTVLSVVPFVDAWISIFLAGGIIAFFTWLIAKLCVRFPGETFFDFSPRIITKPITILLTVFISLHFLAIVSYEVRAVATISKHYIFDRTPLEVIAFIFALLIAYAVSGSRAALLRLNMMFFPIVVLILFLVLSFNLPLMEFGNLKPFFAAKWSTVLLGTKETMFAYVGFEVLLFYIALIRKEELKSLAKYPVFGLISIGLFYLLVFFVAVAVLGVEAAEQINYPTVELAKEVEVPGGVIERLDPLFFTVWVMTIFNTSTIAFDVLMMSLQSLFKKAKKSTWILVIIPVIYFLSMMPQDILQLRLVGDAIGYSGLVVGIFIPLLLIIVAHLKGVKGT
jgi:spore germination protein